MILKLTLKELGVLRAKLDLMEQIENTPTSGLQAKISQFICIVFMKKILKSSIIMLIEIQLKA